MAYYTPVRHSTMLDSLLDTHQLGKRRLTLRPSLSTVSKCASETTYDNNCSTKILSTG